MRFRRLIRVLSAPVLVLAAGGALAINGAETASATPSTYVCTGGDSFVPAGTYTSVNIEGDCYMPAGNIVIQGNLNIGAGDLLDAVSPGDPSGHHAVPATVTVGGNLNVGTGAVLGLGCSPNISCANPPAITYDHVAGNLVANGAMAVILHSASIGGNVSLNGGGNGIRGGASCAADPAPWSSDPNLDGVPVYTDVEDTVIGGNLTVSNIESCWLGSLRNQIGGSAAFNNNVFGDPDAMEIGDNLIDRNFACDGNNPAAQFGEGAAPDLVGGSASGQCAFNVVLPNPAPEAGEGPGVPTHFTVSTSSLGNYSGTHTATPVGTIPIGVTSSGDTLAVESAEVALAGTGLTTNPGSSSSANNEKVAVTVLPNGSELFTAYDSCSCSFQGHTGEVSIRAYGTVTPSGLATGTFLVTGGNHGLATLVGDGQFSSAGQSEGVLKVLEHLDIS